MRNHAREDIKRLMNNKNFRIPQIKVTGLRYLCQRFVKTCSR